MATRAGGLHTLLLNKYYVDEIYDAAIVQPIKLASDEGLWKRVDVQVIDGAVNGVGGSVERHQPADAAAADRVAAHVCGVAPARGGAGSGLLPLAMTFPILSSLVALPIVGALLLLLIRDDEANEPLIRKAALVVSLLVFAETLLLWSRFVPSSADFQFVERYAWIPAFGIDYAIGVDGISLLLVVLTGFLTPLALLSSWESVRTRTRAFCMLVLLLESAMLGVFVSIDLFLFYVFWDAMLIPMYFLIGVWGYDRRIYAAVKFLLYTMAGSVLMLIAILALAFMHSRQMGSYSFDLQRLYELNIDPGVQLWLFLAFTLAFAIKVPLFPFHTWLPDAHTEAPTAGSVILAGVLLKMGTYGLVRFAFPLFPQAAAQLAPRISARWPSSGSSTARWSRWCSRT